MKFPSEQIKASVEKFLYFFRITDNDGIISLTHAAMWICIIKLALASPASVADIGALFTAILAYNFKRYLAAQVPKNVEYSSEIEQKFQDLEEKVKDAQGKVNALSMGRVLNPNGPR